VTAEDAEQQRADTHTAEEAGPATGGKLSPVRRFFSALGPGLVVTGAAERNFREAISVESRDVEPRCEGEFKEIEGW
jgi:hypothetical protein